MPYHGGFRPLDGCLQVAPDVSCTDSCLIGEHCRKFIVPASASGTRRSQSLRQASLNISRSGAAIEELGSTIAELDEAICALLAESTSKKPSSLGKKPEKEKHVFGFIKLSHSSPEFSSTNAKDDARRAHPSSRQRAEEALEALKVQYALVLKSLHGGHLENSQGSFPSSLPRTEEEDEPHVRSPSHASFYNKPQSSRRVSLAASSISDCEWFDAPEGAEEFVLDVQMIEGTEQPSRMLTNDSRSSLDDDRSSIDTDINDDRPNTPPVSSPEPHIVRRSELPSPIVADEGSLFAVLKKNVGKDLSTIALPVTFNEPLTLLQRAAEEVEYYDLLAQAASSSDPVEQMCFVAAFAVSSYAHTQHRTGRKGFNPMLAETFEDERMKFIAEKVRHQPVVMAYHAEGPGWELTATSSGKTKFWGKSLEIIPLGVTRLQIGNDHYEWRKPSSFLRNMMVGTKYLEHCGKLCIDNATNGMRCVLEFKQAGYWGATNQVSGVVHSSSDDVVARLDGKWDDQIAQTLDSDHFRVLWRVTQPPKNVHEYYGFTSFGMTLNEVTPDMKGKLPATDSRYRPDVRALEEGDLDTAEAEKVRVEEAQRERRRRGEERQPRWFKEEGDEWVYAGGYWEARARGWKDAPIEPLW
ncbi:hypothetical protein HGRIS_007673 [Hohenbuehelia grisea]|uniref:Oxysterol-binding protein n=1 Tax=Hohenbuehelia grisea TaxID=104357 RepID=A0ABR3J5J4_9AGAR